MSACFKATCLLSFQQEGKEPASCSGVVINAQYGYIISHATLLLPLLTHNNHLLTKLEKNRFLEKNDFRNKTLEALVEFDKPVKRPYNGIITSYKYITSLLNFNSTASSKLDAYTRFIDTEIIHVWRANDFDEILQKLFPKTDKWSFIDTSTKKDQKIQKTSDPDPEKIAFLLPYFVLLKTKQTFDSHGLGTLRLMPSSMLKEGNSVIACGTPFGSLSPPVFFNSISKGVICKVSGKNNSLILTDARCIPGCEGGALYTGDTNRSLAGLVVAPLCWKENEWVGMTIVCGMDSVMTSLKQSLSGRSRGREVVTALEQSVLPANTATDNASTGVSAASCPRVVLVQTPSSWGTGVIVHTNPCLVITCGHVVKDRRWVQVRIDVDTSQYWCGANIVHSVEGQQAFDIALLEVPDCELGLEQLGQFNIKNDIHEGDEVSVVGHAIFGKEHKLQASTCRGVVSKLRGVNGIHFLLMSTCAVHAGASGGPLVADDGSIVSIVTCNAKDTTHGASYPHINLSVPMVTIWPIIAQYISTRDVSVLEKLHIQNKDIQKLWSLQLKSFPDNPPLVSKL